MLIYLQNQVLKGKMPMFLIRRFSLSKEICSGKEVSRFISYRLEGKDYERYFNAVARAREPSLIRRMTDIQSRSTASTISFAGGFPNEDVFPFKNAILTFKSGEKLVLEDEKFQAAQQYGPTTGHPPLLKKVTDLVERYHKPPNFGKSKVIVTAGSQDAFSRCLEMILTPGDFVVIEKPSFCGALSIIKPFGVGLLAIESDECGMIPQALRDALYSRWSPEEVKDKDHGIPKVIYVNPNATNPTGVSTATERKREIYEIAREYNLLIIEDDPYYFLQFGFPEEYAKSFLSMDEDGRVLRCDSFSKIVCGGFRVGFLTGPTSLVSKVVQHSEVTILHTSSISQVIVNELLDHWSIEGLEKHIIEVRDFYQKRRDVMNAAAKKHLSELCEWNIPTGGMFLWVKVLDLEDTTEMALERAINKELLVMPGNTFMVDESEPCPYLRLSFSYSSPEAMEEGCRRLAELIIEEIEISKNTEKREKTRPQWLEA